MTNRRLAVILGLPILMLLANGQGFGQGFGGQYGGAQGGAATIQARIKPGGGDGKCTFEVVVDQVAEVQVRGGTGFLRTISGRPATWRRLDCNGPMPLTPASFRFKGIDGRGKMTLVQDPNAANGAAVVRIQDPKGGGEGYTGDLIWRKSNSDTFPNDYGNGGGNTGGGWSNNGNGGWNNGGNSGWNNGGSGWNNNNGRNISMNDAMGICQNAVASQSGAGRDEVRVNGDGNNNNGNRGGYNVNFQIRSRNSRLDGITGACQISADGRVQDIRH